jgi:hypothetical protein
MVRRHARRYWFQKVRQDPTRRHLADSLMQRTVSDRQDAGVVREGRRTCVAKLFVVLSFFSERSG